MSTESVQQPGLEDEDLLEGWKAIADHLNKTERTVQRWEKAKALPVRRLKSGSSEDQGRVFAYKKELDAWWQEMLTRPDESRDLTPDPDRPPGHSPQPSPLPPPSLPARPWHSSSFWVAIALAVILGVVALLRMLDPAKNLRPQPSRGRVTLAVRQFRNLNDTSNNDASSQDFVAVGLTEEMVTHLGQLHPQQMSVIRLTPGYATATLDRLAKDIRADYVLEGSIPKKL